jgi:hypothetical protein
MRLSLNTENICLVRMSGNPSFRPPPEEPPAPPLEPAIAKARAAYVKSNVEKVKTLKEQGKSKEEIQEEVARFAADYPALFKMLMNTENYNEGSLRTMLAMLERMGSGQLTQDQASVIVGQRLHDVYIKPKIDGLPPQGDTR